jgi:hypothetical protein
VKNPNAPKDLGRRDALKMMATAATVSAVSCDAGQTQTQDVPRTPSDPDLVRPTVPWEKVLTPEEMATAATLCDVIIPADARSPSASAVGVPDYINEYVSAPYPSQQRDQIVIRGGLAWLNTEATRRFGAPFAQLTSTQRHQICDDIKFVPNAAPEFIGAARFFAKFRDLVATGFYTTDAGMNDIGYIGNVALARFDGPPPEVLRHLGLDG